MSYETPTQPPLAYLLTRFLNERAQAHVDGLVDFDPLAKAGSADVTPYDAGLLQPIDAKLAWTEALAAAPYFQPGMAIKKWTVPPDWASLVAGHEPVVALPFCLGNFPQLVRRFDSIFPNASRSGFSASAGSALTVPALVRWTEQVAANKQWPQMLLALGSLRLAKNFDQAESFAAAHDGAIPREWRAAWENEKAALAWHQGRADAARDLWNTLQACVPVLFNRGLADIFGGDAARGSAAMDAVAAQIPDTSAWHHLARLYALLANSR
jgi:hypothetical protein